MQRVMENASPLQPLSVKSEASSSSIGGVAGGSSDGVGEKIASLNSCASSASSSGSGLSRGHTNSPSPLTLPTTLSSSSSMTLPVTLPTTCGANITSSQYHQQRSTSVDSTASMPGSSGLSLPPPCSINQRSTSVDSSSSFAPPASPRLGNKPCLTASSDSLKMSTAGPCTLSKTSGFTANIKHDLHQSFSQPASPAKSNFPMGCKTHSHSHDNLPHAARSLTGHPSFQMPPQVNINKKAKYLVVHWAS